MDSREREALGDFGRAPKIVLALKIDVALGEEKTFATLVALYHEPGVRIRPWAERCSSVSPISSVMRGR